MEEHLDPEAISSVFFFDERPMNEPHVWACTNGYYAANAETIRELCQRV